jgi:hypothetical protein
MEIKNLQLPNCIQVIGSSDCGTVLRVDFVVNTDNLLEASRSLAISIQKKWSLFVNDHRRGDSEGGLIIKEVNGKLRLMTGGHGYSSDWNFVSDDEVEKQIEAVLIATKWGKAGGHFDIPLTGLR